MNILTEPVWSVAPVAVFCVKTRDTGGSEQKIFLNFCVCDELPAPNDISESELAAVLESDDPGSYKIPISLGEAHGEADKSGAPCTAYDVIVNEGFYREKVKSSELFRTFLVVVALDALFDKYSVSADKKDWVVLKNRKNVGEIKPQNIRRRPRPMIVELAEEKIEPKFVLYKDSVRNPRKITGEFHLPDVTEIDSIDLQIGDDRILLKIDEKNFFDVSIPLQMDADRTSAEYSAEKNILFFESYLKTN